MKDVITLLKNKGNAAAETVSELAIKDISIVESLIDALSSSHKKLKNGSIKSLHIISEKRPSFLYDYFDIFYELLDSSDTILKWNAIDIISNFSDIDKDAKINEEVMAKFFELLHDESMITSAHSIDNLWKIAINKPDYEKLITHEITHIDKIERNEECKNINIGKAIMSMSQYFIYSRNKNDILEFVNNNKDNSRNATKKKVDKFLKKFNRYNDKDDKSNDDENKDNSSEDNDNNNKN